ncbi:Rap1a/Tai family immunity protein [Flavobacterium sp.]|jgi:hypothetical protein|uniref:Rap1a/Tai family immunity protein n=1 Tax=Flavobacterium sp. TaxID=239 RepID=UPI0037BE29C5
MSKVKHLAVAAMLVCTGAQAQTHFKTGNELLQEMTSEESAERMLALGYLAGTFDVVAGTEFCPPKNINLGQVRDLVRKHLELHPEARHLVGSAHVTVALERVWPCRKKGGV